MKKQLTTMYTVFLIIALSTAGPALLSAKKTGIPEILEKTANYCEKLQDKAFHFMCSETIEETVEKSLEFPQARRGLKNFLEGHNRPSTPGSTNRADRKMQQVYDNLDQNRRNRGYKNKRAVKKNILVNEYQIIKVGERLKERRLMREINGQKVKPQKVPNIRTTVYSYKNVLSPINFFSKENQSSYRYRLAGKEKIMGRKAYVIEIETKNPDSELEKGVLVKAWVDREDYSVIKFEVFPGAFGGADYLLRADSHGKTNVKISDIHYFGQLKGGIRYPTKTEILITYNEDPKEGIETSHKEKSHGARILTNILTTYSYHKYIFFNVTVDDPVFHN